MAKTGGGVIAVRGLAEGPRALEGVYNRCSTCNRISIAGVSVHIIDSFTGGKGGSTNSSFLLCCCYFLCGPTTLYAQWLRIRTGAVEELIRLRRGGSGGTRSPRLQKIGIRAWSALAIRAKRRKVVQFA